MADGVKNTFSELGASGLTVMGGRIYEEPLRELSGDKWRRAVREMMTNDSVINASLFAIEMLARQVSWDLVPADESNEAKKEAEFFRQCLFEDMSNTWQETLSEILSFLPWGWAYFEECYKRRSGESRDKTKNSRFTDGRIGLRKLAIRAQESLYEWQFDDFNEVSAMVQQPAPDYILRTIPIEKALLFRTSAHKGNPEGRSILRGAYRAWYFKNHIENMEGIGIERDFTGVPSAGLPPEYFAANASPDQIAMRNGVAETLKNLKLNEQQFVLYPLAYNDKDHPLFKMDLMSSPGQRQFDTNTIIARWNHQILITTLTDFLLLGSQKVGSYSLSTDKTELFGTALGAWLDTICDTINHTAIPRLGILNAIPQALLPKLAHGSTMKINLKALGEYLNKLGAARVSFDDEEKAYLKRQANIPASKKKESTSTAGAGSKTRNKKSADDKKSDEKEDEQNQSDE
jgi:hypothetical protein